MKRKLTSLLRLPQQRGQSLVELAISLTVMLMLLSGAVTFGMALFSYVAIRDAASEGALYGSITPQDSGGNLNWANICARVKAASTTPVDMNSFTCTHDGAGSHSGANRNNIDVVAMDRTCEGAPTSGTGANGMQVRVEYDFPIMMPYVGGIIGSQTIHLNAVVTDTILTPRCP